MMMQQQQQQQQAMQHSNQQLPHRMPVFPPGVSMPPQGYGMQQPGMPGVGQYPGTSGGMMQGAPIFNPGNQPQV